MKTGRSIRYKKFYLLCIERDYGRIGNTKDYSYRFIEEKNLPELEKHILFQIKSVSEISNILDAIDYGSIGTLWKYLEYESFSDYIKEKLKCSQNIPKFLLHIASFWNGRGTHGWTFIEENFSEFISKDNAYTKLLSTKGTFEFSSLDLKFKEIAIAFFLWYGLERDDYYKISQEKVHGLLPEWEKS